MNPRVSCYFGEEGVSLNSLFFLVFLAAIWLAKGQPLVIFEGSLTQPISFSAFSYINFLKAENVYFNFQYKSL